MYICCIYVRVDEKYCYQGQVFEWDLEKAAANLLKHGVSFEKASEIFFDPFVCVVDATDEGVQAREAAIGFSVDLKMLYVVHVIREGSGIESIRIISARAATSRERSHYENQ
ncbi:MAG TPA: BrnT family toxin [Acidobacteriaceae bacterium]|nr:BrnT family toxin [Acidobacteriaceae bacterium]